MSATTAILGKFESVSYKKIAMHLIDLSHTIEHGLITYKGLPAPIICDFLSREKSRDFYEDGTEFQIGKIEMVGNSGNYIDCPFHRFADGKDLSEVALDKFADLDALVITHDYLKNGLAIDKQVFQNLHLQGKAVLVHTNWCQKWNTDAYYENHPHLTKDAAEYLVQQKVKLVGIDSYNIDSTTTNQRPVHSILLKNEILIVEHLTNLNQLPSDTFKFSAVPPKIKGMGTFPVRAFARIVD